MGIAEIAAKAHDLEGKTVGVMGTWRIGQRVCTRLKAFDINLLYYNNFRLCTVEEFVLGLRYTPLEEIIEKPDII
jgi:formate dehydrogenase